MMYPSVTPHWEFYEVHIDEAEFLWGQWERALTAPDRRLEQVVQREARLLAHVDALALGGEEGAQRFLLPALSSEEMPRAAAAALALLQQEGYVGRDAVLAALAHGPPEALPGLQRALEVCGREDVLPGLSTLFKPDADPLVAAVALEVYAAHGCSPAVPLLTTWLEHSEPTVVAAACRVLPFMNAVPTAPLLHLWKQAVESPESRVRDMALVSGAVLGFRAAWARCRQVVEAAHGAPGRLPLLLLALGGGPKEQGLLVELLGNAGLRADVAWALGHSGRSEAAEACLGLLEDADAQVVRLATESFAVITGFPLEGSHVLPQEETEESDDALSLPDMEEMLPRAEPHAARAWWTHACEHGRFKPGARYLAGIPFSAAALVQAFRTEPSRRWPALALELAIRSRGRHCVSARDFSTRRHRQLAAFKGFAPRGEQPFSSLLDL